MLSLSCQHSFVKPRVQGSLLRIGDVVALINKCEQQPKPENVKYVFDGIQLIHSKGWDFSAQISSLFVKFCLSNGAGKEAAELLAKKDHRLSAWVTLKPYTSLTEFLASNGETELMIDLTKNLIGKGAHVPSEWAAEQLLKAASAKGDAAVYAQAVTVAAKMIPSPDLDKLKQTYKAPEASTPAAEEAK